MAHSLSAKKRVRQTAKIRARNRARKDVLKTETKAFNAALTAGDAGKAGEALTLLVKRLDRTAAKHTIHKKAAARRRSRATLRLNALKASGPVAAATKSSGKSKAKKA